MLSADRQSHWTHLIAEGLLRQEPNCYQNKDLMIRAIRRALSSFVQEQENINQRTRQKIAGLKRKVTEHSTEWEALFARYYEEELSRSHLRGTDKK